MQTEENLSQEEVNKESKINWSGIALQTCITTVSALIGGFAAAAGAHMFARVVNGSSSKTDLSNVVELKSKFG